LSQPISRHNLPPGEAQTRGKGVAEIIGLSARDEGRKRKPLIQSADERGSARKGLLYRL